MPDKKKTHISCRDHKHKLQVERIIAELITSEFSAMEYVNIAIGGPGGSGKSTFAAGLLPLLQSTALLPLDDYKTSRTSRYGKNLYGAHPEANKMSLICSHLQQIKRGNLFQRPVYNAVTGTADSKIEFTPAKFNIIEGEISTYHQFRDYIDLAIFIDSDWRTQLKTRINRDINERCYSEEKAIATFLQSNLREFRKYGAESKKWSDIHIYCRNDYRLELESVEENLFKKHSDIFCDNFSEIPPDAATTAVKTQINMQGELDLPKYIAELEATAAAGIHRVIIGNVQEGRREELSLDERRLLLITARRYFPGEVIFDVSSCSIKLTRKMLEYTVEAGADAAYVDTSLIKSIPGQEFIDTAARNLDIRIIHAENL
ncbi:hypothetical protein P0136_05170 [Lentisphaerota bacterium ZTH]|nr:hypothetical protein JYG24_03715 [Lentisphaerota bacterium]WET07381.1 hypothetical protein P0136_05170 [Lentisphaerota bacterium ZTH]